VIRFLQQVDGDCTFTGMAVKNMSHIYERSGALSRALEFSRESLRIWQTLPGSDQVAEARSRVRYLERALK
jgi:hypothetical protein